MTRTEAAQALAQAAIDVAGYWIDASRVSPTFGAHIQALRNALDAYRDSTPDALPAEVARVVEAAERYIDKDTHETWHELAAASRAYSRRSTQPDPLPARLARLKPGSVVESDEGHGATVVANDPEVRMLWVRTTSNHNSGWDYPEIARILSEAP